MRNDIIRKLFQIQRNAVSVRSNSSQINIQKLESEPEVAEGKKNYAVMILVL